MPNHPATQPPSESQLILQRQELRATQFSGPLPPPDILEEYEKLLPGAAERIFAAFEKQTEHRQSLEKHVVKDDTRRSWAGLVAAFLLASFCVIGGVICVLHGHTAAGATIATASVATLAAVFVYGSNLRAKERQAKAAEQMVPKKK
ncbi:MAG: DUF2335 domain-containing protein [Gemmataceae bacterium]